MSDFRPMCFLVLPQAVALPELVSIKQDFARRFPALAKAAQSEAGQETAELFTLAGTMFTLLKVDAPLPNEEWEFPVKQNLNSPAAQHIMQSHKVHVVIAPFQSAANLAEAKRLSLLVSALAITLAHLLPATAAIWPTGRNFVTAEQLKQFAASVNQGDAPITLWTGILFGQGKPSKRSEPTFGAMTTGLQPFFGREVEFEPAAVAPQIVGHRLIGALTILFTQGPVLKEGDTIGVSETERIRVTHLAQTVRPGVPIVKLAIETLDKTVAPAAAVGKTTFGKRRT